MTITPSLSNTPQTKRELASKSGYSVRDVELLIQAARLEGAPICSSADGYWLATRWQDVETCHRRLRRRATNQLITARALRRTARRMEAEQALTLFGDVAA
jgi:biotin operon repressor